MKRLPYLSAFAALPLFNQPLQALEYIVTNRNDSGSGSLRQAITAANNNPGADTIVFGLFADDGLNGTVTTFTPLSPLPSITDTLHIDGTTAWGFNTTTRVPAVVINGASAGAGAHGLAIGANNCVIEALSIVNFGGSVNSGSAISIGNGQFSSVEGCWLGTLPTWDPAPNGRGMVISSSFNTIGGGTLARRNVISNNLGDGIRIQTTAGGSNDIQGNYIGTTPDGVFRNANGNMGIFITDADGTIIGSAGSGFRNIIAGNENHGIYLTSQANGSVITNNYIGLNVNGADFGNRCGIFIANCDNTVIGVPGAGNVIGSNRTVGIHLGNQGNPALSVSRGTKIQGNSIGTTPSGNGDRPNGLPGIVATDAEQSLIGGDVTGEGNTIIGNTSAQIWLEGPNVNTVTVSGNYLSAGDNPSGNTGVVMAGCFGCLIGSDGLTTVGWNRIVDNNGAGIHLIKSGGYLPGTSYTSINNRIHGNYIGLPDGLGNGTGIRMDAGGGTEITSNYICSSGYAGIELRTFDSSTSRITGNSIGVLPQGIPGQGGQLVGIMIQGSSNNTIGGNGTLNFPGSANVIANNQLAGIQIVPEPSDGSPVQWHAQNNRVLNNLIGLKLGEQAGARTQAKGIDIKGGAGNIIGGSGTAEGNVFGGNNVGIQIEDSGLRPLPVLTVEGNRFGTGADDLLRHYYSIYARGAVNAKIRFNDFRYGSSNSVVIADTDGRQIELSRNTWQQNADLPVDISEDNVTNPLDGSPDNSAQNHPEILSARASALGYEVAGRIVSSPLSFMRIEMYSGIGNQPEAYHAASTVFTDAEGYAPFSIRIPGTVPTSRILTATATEPGDDATPGTTSEFSPPVSLRGLLANKWGIMAIRRAGNDILLDIPTLPGLAYSVKTSTTTNGGWTTLETFNASSSLRTVRHSSAIAPGFPRRFYRVEEDNF